MSGYEGDSDTDHSSQIEISSDSTSTLEVISMDTDSTYDSDPSMDVMVIDSGSSDSSSDLMVIDIDSDDSSIQIIEPPPPEIVDLVSDDSDFIELLDLDPPLPELTSTPSDTVPAPFIPEPVPEREEPTIPEILSQFEPTPYPYAYDIPRVMDRYQFETLVSAPTVDTPIPPPVSTTPLSAPITSVSPITVPVHAPMTTPTQFEGPPPIPDPAFPAFDFLPPFEHQSLVQRYLQVRESVHQMRAGFQGSQDPLFAPARPGFLARDTGSEIMYQIAISVFQRLRADIQAVPSTSSGLVSGPMISMMVDRAFAEFLRRVFEIFY